MAKQQNFEGWVAVVTGGAGALSRSFTPKLMARGIRCLLVDIDAERLDFARQTIGGDCQTYVADVSDELAVRELTSWVETSYGRVDLLINNAATTETTPFEQRSMSSIRDEVGVNLLAPLIVTRSFMPLLQRAGDGRVITVASLGGIFPLPETSVYSAAKFGLRGAMLCLGLDSPRTGVKVTTISPSAIECGTLMREAMSGGNKLQFGDPPQQPEALTRQLLSALDDPKLEVYTRKTESWLSRIAMLFPNSLSALIPSFKAKGERGHQRYLDSLERRGLIVKRDGVWTMVPRR